MFSTTGPGTDEVTSPALGEDRRSIPTHRLVGGVRHTWGARALVHTLRRCCWELHPDRGACSYLSERALLVKFRAGEERRGGPIGSEPCGVSLSASGDGGGGSMVCVRVVEGSCDAARGFSPLPVFDERQCDRSGMSSTEGTPIICKSLPPSWHLRSLFPDIADSLYEDHAHGTQ